VGCVWGIGERKWGGDFRRRMMIFESMIESILMYGTEIWGWKEEGEKMQEKYLRGVLGVERETPAYLKRNRLRVDGRQECWREKKKKHGEEGESEILPEKLVCQ
jgi:hypothetical protein